MGVKRNWTDIKKMIDSCEQFLLYFEYIDQNKTREKLKELGVPEREIPIRVSYNHARYRFTRNGDIHVGSWDNKEGLIQEYEERYKAKGYVFIEFKDISDVKTNYKLGVWWI